MSNLVRQSNWQPLEKLAQQENVKARFQQVLGARAPQFIASMISLGNSMPDVEPKSILGSCMQAATLDLPIERNLGFAWVIPYKKGDTKYAQFQMGYKGYIQLALRTGQYERMNAVAVNKEVYIGRDEVGEPKLDWDKLNSEKPAAGYAFGFKTVNGFIKVFYWPKEKVVAHAKRYSKAYNKAIRDNDKSSPWIAEFDKMGIKTVIANELPDWGPLSVQWVKATSLDNTVTTDIDAKAEIVSDPFEQTNEYAERKETITTEPNPPETAVAGDGDKNISEQQAEKRTILQETQEQDKQDEKSENPKRPSQPPDSGRGEGSAASSPSSAILGPDPGDETISPQQMLQKLTLDNGYNFTLVQKWGEESQNIPNASSYPDFTAIPTNLCNRILRAKQGYLNALAKQKP